MKHHDDVEKALADTPVPRLVEGSHRARLKSDLMSEIGKEGSAIPRMIWTWKKKFTWAACALLVVAATAWGAHKVSKKFIFQEEHVEEVLPDGREVIRATTLVVRTNDPDFTDEKAQEMNQEIQDLMAQGKAELIEVKELGRGQKAYIYRVVLSNGTSVTCASGTPLELSGEQADEGSP